MQTCHASALGIVGHPDLQQKKKQNERLWAWVWQYYKDENIGITTFTVIRRPNLIFV